MVQGSRKGSSQKEEIATISIRYGGRAWRYNVFVSGVAHGCLHFPRDFVRVKHCLDVVREYWNCSDALLIPASGSFD